MILCLLFVSTLGVGGSNLPYDLASHKEELLIISLAFYLLEWSGTSKLLMCQTGNLINFLNSATRRNY